MFKRLLIIFGLLVYTPAWANTIALHTNISADNAITGVNSNFSTISNWAAGNIEGSTDGGTTVNNIKADSLFEINMADDTNPRVRDSELFNITTDTISGGAVSSQNTVVESGCVPATDTDLTSDVSACVVYVNGYRVSKAATAITYGNNTTTYVWISQTGNYTASTNPNSTIANSALLASVVTSGGQITTVNSLFTTRVPGLLVPSNYRQGLVVSRDSTTTLTVFPGTVEINNTMLTKTAVTTLTITTAGDYASGSSERAASQYGFVLMDASGNLKLDVNDPPSYSNYAVSSTVGKLRYDTWHSTVYRALGWFYLDGAQNIENASNIKEGDVANTVSSQDTNLVTFSSTAFADVQLVNFYNSGGHIVVSSTISGDSSGGAFDYMPTLLRRDSTDVVGCGSSANTSTGLQGVAPAFTCLENNRQQGNMIYRARARVSGNSVILRARNMVVAEQ